MFRLHKWLFDAQTAEWKKVEIDSILGELRILKDAKDAVVERQQ
jgi:hypothetical protein